MNLLIKKITSLQNEKVKSLIKLRKRSQRTKSNKTFVDGTREVLRVMNNTNLIKEFFINKELLSETLLSKIYDYARSNRTAIYECENNVFKKIAYRENSDGLIAIVNTFKRKLDDIFLSKNPLILVSDGIEKPGNIGALIRAADAAGADALVLINSKTDILNPNVIRSSIATVFLFPVIECNIDCFFNYVIRNKIQTVGLIPAASESYITTDLRIPTAIIVGSEANGISEYCKKRLSKKISIKMNGHNDSLNVSTAAAITLFECLRQRNSINKN